MRRLSALLLLVLLTGCQPAPTRIQPATGSTTSSPRTEPDLNPHVTPPPGRVQVAPDLPAATAPLGMLSQQQVIAQVLDSYRNSPDRLTLSKVKFNPFDNLWEVTLTVDDPNLAVRPRSTPGLFTTNDPVERRKQDHSWLCVASELHGFLDGRTGQGRGGGHACGAPDRSRTGLEHYRGVILYGGETTILRLINPDGTREGRDLAIDIPQSVLDADHLALWQVQYGVNRTLDVWGLTGPQKRVVAYRLAMSDPPPEALLHWSVAAGVPVYPGALDRGGDPDRSVFLARATDAAQLIRWYEEQMPAYGWQRQGVSQGPGQAIQFRGAGGVVVQLGMTPVPDGTEIALTWVSGRPAAGQP